MLTPTDYADIFVAAIEGGINYWAVVDDYQFDQGSRFEWAHARIYDIDGEQSHLLDSRSENWHNAVANAASHFNMSLEDFFEDHDAGSADVAVQFALFGEVVYG